MLNQRLQQKLLQRLSPQQIMLMQLIQIPTLALEQRIKQEIEENPALEELAESDEPQDQNEGPDTSDEDSGADDDAGDADDEFDLSDYMDDDEYIPAYKLNANNTSSDDEPRQTPFVSGTSFHEFLLSQLGLHNLDEKQRIIAKNIIGNLDDSGYLQREPAAMVDDLAFSQSLVVSRKEIEEVLSIIQTFDPAGVGARNLKECLVLQLKRVPQTPSVEKANLLLSKYFDEFTRKHYDKILKKSGMTEAELREAIGEIIRLNPKPGNSLGETERVNHHIIPDFIITINDDEPELALNNRGAPELRVNRSYQEMLETYSESRSNNQKSKEAVMFIKQKIDKARWFIDAIRQRQNTLYVTMKTIMDYQREYFLTGDETLLRPMILKDIAEIVNLDISTVSRVAKSKYVQTPYGTFLIKTFFSESMQTDSGEEVSSREIKKILSDCVEAEDKSKPMTDDHLTDVLREKGYNIARRTVAKYREQLNIPVARLRKEL
jgi:RNA polymerase sigma-54 factor